MASCMAFQVMLAHLAVMLMIMAKASADEAFPFPIANPGCNASCGNVKIPYPFGMTQECSLGDPFLINCDTSYNPPHPFLGWSQINVSDISLDGQLHILKLIARKCFNRSQELPAEGQGPSFSLAQFTVNDTLNKFTAVGCDTYGFIDGFRGVKRFTTGCMSICGNIDEVLDGVCSGGGCCQTAIPKGLTKLNLTVGSYENHVFVQDFNPCSSAFIVEQGGFNFSIDSLKNLESIQKLPLALDWTIGNQTCEMAQKNLSTYVCHNNTKCISDPDLFSGYRCSCLEGFEGNPYLPGIGCRDIDECRDENLNTCAFKELCVNLIGRFACSCPVGFYGNGKGENGCIPSRRKRQHNQLLLARILAGIAVSIAALVVFCTWLYFFLKRKKLMQEREKFFRDNGGLVLQERLIKQEGSKNMAKIFSAKELENATDNFNESRIIGQGGFGTVYKGFLTDNRIVAIKKSKLVDRTQIDQFINEVIVLSQINHRNVVKLLGCCLETEVPLLVYEFINNGTLFDHLQEKAKASALSWDTRLRIAAETAEALSYLHSAASPPIIHRDVKSVNILLDDRYTAKVSDFGASRLVPVDQTELSTMVQGTLGYLDPEYLQTSQLTEKSDVYSFGVVLVELLTGKKALCYERSERDRNLANHFLSSLKENGLFQILEGGLVKETGMVSQINEVAMLAKKCLDVKGESRPTMKEVAAELEGRLRLATKHSWIPIPPEEVEGLLEVPLQPHEYVDLNIKTIVYDSIKKHLILPVTRGR